MKMDTIAAISTGMGNAGIGIVRVSGKDACMIIDEIFVGKRNKKLSKVKSHTIHYGYIMEQGEQIDEVLVMVMRSPNSYTTEDTVEINCHGGSYVTRRILEIVIRHGARPADPGEFTKRAFLNGRIDLSQSEAVIDIINSQNELALKNSVNQLQGSIKEKIKLMRDRIIYEIAFIESALDDPEHISVDGYVDKLLPIVDNLLIEVENLLKTSENGKLLKEGINTVIVGKPNVGKSSLLNVLVGQERAIVTEVAGTTRDVLEESIMLGGLQLNIIDTAGIRRTDDIVEKIGVKRAKQYAENADLIIYVVDASNKLDENDDAIINMLQNKQTLVLLNKSDLESVVTEEDMRKRLDKEIFQVSAKEQQGIEQLSEKIQEMFFDGEVSFNNEIYITNARHKSELLRAKDSLELVKQSALNGMPEDFYSIDLMSAYEALGNIIGESVEEDLVNEIFAKFCMGK